MNFYRNTTFLFLSKWLGNVFTLSANLELKNGSWIKQFYENDLKYANMSSLTSPVRSGSIAEIETTISRDSWHTYYTVEETIGRGKFAIVKKCIEKSTGKKYAAKVMRKRRHCRDCTADIFHEIAVLEISSVHPNLINLKQVYESSSEVVLILEFAAGGEIFDHCVGLKDQFSEQTIRRMFRQILDAVSFLHIHDIVHLDLKPQNILLTDEGEKGDIRLVDFGLSKKVDQKTEIREILGTPDYVAPEVLNFEPIGISTDIWSLGVVFYVMLTGVSPFLGESKQETLMNVTTAAVDFPHDLFKNKHDSCKDLIMKMLQRAPQSRLSASECLKHPWFAVDLNQVGDTKTIESEQNGNNDVFEEPSKYQDGKSPEERKNDDLIVDQKKTVDTDVNGNVFNDKSTNIDTGEKSLGRGILLSSNTAKENCEERFKNELKPSTKRRKYDSLICCTNSPVCLVQEATPCDV